MIRLSHIALAAAALLGVASVGSARQADDGVPEQPFQTLHLMAADSSQQGALKAAVDDFDREFVRQGCAACAYRLSRRVVGSQSPLNVLIMANWPDRRTYLRIHGSPGYQAVEARHPVFDALQSTQLYGRFVEVR